MTSFCPVTGSTIYTQSEWINQRVSSSFASNFSIIDSRIVYSQPMGKADANSLRASLEINRQVFELVSKRHPKFVQIEDYAQLTGSSSEARRLFTRTMDRTSGLSALIFCNLSTALSIAVNIGNRFNTNGKDIHVVKHYDDAVKLAIALTSHDKAVPDEPQACPIDLSKYIDSSERSLRPVELMFGDSLNLNIPGFSSKTIVIDQSIIHSTSIGCLESRHIPTIDEYHRCCDSIVGNTHPIEYVIVDIEGMIGTSGAARIEYMKILKRWHEHSPFRMYIGYGASTFLKTAFILGKAMMPFKVRVAKDIGHAFQLIRDDKKSYASVKSSETKKDSPYVVSPTDLEQLLGFIGNINWESQGIPNDGEVNQDHPFFFLYQSIKLIKEEIDELFFERKNFESQLYQARKMESVGTIAAGIAHDINNILCMISGNVQLALNDVPRGSPVLGYLEDIDKAGQRAEGVVKQLLDFSRRRDSNHKPLDAVEVIRDALRLLRATIPTTVEIREELPDFPVNISSDSTQINQILINLFANAAQAMEDTGGALNISVCKELIFDVVSHQYPVRRAGEYLKLTVSDTGPGIRPDHIDRIFDPYFTTKEIGHGSGMGLAVVLGIVKAHDGSITVSSEIGKGTTFTILFPIIDEKPALDIESTEEVSAGTESIMVVEDEEAIATIMRRMLEPLGYRIETFLNPKDALAAFRSEPALFDLVITDMTMPGMTGVELAKSIRDIRTDMPVIVCTGYSPLVDDNKIKQLGIAALAMKPLDMRKLTGVIRSVLDDRVDDEFKRIDQQTIEQDSVTLM